MIRKRALQSVFLSLTILALGTYASATTSNKGPGLTVEILSGSTLFDYRVDYATPEVELSGSEQVASTHDELVRLTRSIDSYRNEIIAAVSNLDAKSSQTVKWASISPNKRYAIAGFVDPRYQPVGNAVLLDGDGEIKLPHIQIGENMEWCLWSPDSSKVAILGVDERTSLWPIDLLLALSGHPVKLKTYHLILIDPVTTKTQHMVIAKDIKDGIAVVK